ncbi:hypothetical protein ACFYVL_36015 [Streptomyces sp. NPDC004111]|uniref:hypothetical protein n=1 Tax=Streptomyces sp. NPDC004111 TaxID=3364690 RepID=UPI00367BD21E
MSSESPSTELTIDKAELSSGQDILFTPEWIPDTGHSVIKIGVYVGAVRVYGEFGRAVAARLHTVTEHRSGAVVTHVSAPDAWYFLTEPGAGAGLRWPPGVKLLGVERDDYLGIPALTGPTAPYAWWAAPTHEAPLVDPSTLHTVCCALSAWQLGRSAATTGRAAAGGTT